MFFAYIEPPVIVRAARYHRDVVDIAGKDVLLAVVAVVLTSRAMFARAKQSVLDMHCLTAGARCAGCFSRFAVGARTVV